MKFLTSSDFKTLTKAWIFSLFSSPALQARIFTYGLVASACSKITASLVGFNPP